MSRPRLTLRFARSRRTAISTAVLGTLAVAGCGSTPVTLSAKHSPTPSAANTATARPTAAPTPTPAQMAVAGATYTAPALVQIENLNAARPESGLSSANIVYEYSAEGGIGRFTAVYFSTPKGTVGPIRSARLISPVLVDQYGGTLIYSGSSVYVFHRMVAEHTPRLDETDAGHDMFRITSRFAPHNLYSDGGRIDDMVRRSNRAPVTYTLWSRSTTAPGARPASSFVAPVSPSERPAYTWNAAAGGWTRTEPDTGTFTDANTNAPVIAPTVVVMQVPARINPDDIENGCCTAGWEYTMSGTGVAQVFTGGQEWDAQWSQGASGVPKFTLAGGAAAPIAPGLVWICVVPQGQAAAFH